MDKLCLAPGVLHRLYHALVRFLCIAEGHDSSTLMMNQTQVNNLQPDLGYLLTY